MNANNMTIKELMNTLLNGQCEVAKALCLKLEGVIDSVEEVGRDESVNTREIEYLRKILGLDNNW